MQRTPLLLLWPRLLPLIAASAGIALFAIMDGAMKQASLLAGVYTAMLARSLVGAVLMVPVWWFSPGAARRLPGAALLRMHALRGVVCAGMAVSFFWGLVRTPMAEAIAISFLAPLIALFLAAAMLGERIRWPAIAAALLGLAGVAVIVLARLSESGTPGGEAAWGIASILLSAVLYAWNLILQRQQALVAGPVEVALFQSIFVGLTLALLAPWLAHMPAAGAWPWIGGAALLVMVSLMLLSWAWGRAEAQLLLPIEYTAFVWSALMGWLLFGEALTVPTLAGAALIIAACWIGTRTSEAHSEQTAL